jgi:xanthine dehydrogenase molybdenum-binding subunit
MAEEYRIIGKLVPRTDMSEKVTGKAKYIRDVRIAGMLHTKILKSPHAHARITKIDTSGAEALPGVVAVLTYKNIPEGWTAHALGSILDEKVRYIGDQVAVVAAESEEIAEEALDLIDVEYEVLPAVLTMEDALTPGASLVHDEYEGNIVVEGTLSEWGDVDGSSIEADVIVEASYSIPNPPTPFLSLEARGTIAWWEGDKVVVMRSDQSPYNTQSNVSSITGLPLTSIRCINPYIGGDGSSKWYVPKDLEFAVALAKITDRPVGVFQSKEEHCIGYTRVRTEGHYRFGLKADGTVVFVDGELNGDGGAYYDCFWAIATGAQAPPACLANFPNMRITGKAIVTNTGPRGPCRGWGYLTGHWTFAPMMWKAIEAVDMDPYDFFMKNTIKLGDEFNWGGPQTCTFEPIANAAKEAAEIFGWENKWKGWGTPTSVSGSKIRAVGVGWGGACYRNNASQTATVALSHDGGIFVTPGIGAYGSGQRESLPKYAAEVLKVPYNTIDIPPSDTAAQQYFSWQVGNCGTFSHGNAVMLAAEDAKRKLLELAAPLFEANPEDLETEDRIVYLKGDPEVNLTWGKVIPRQLSVIGIGDNIRESGKYPTIFASFAEIELDNETGGFDVVDLIIATNVGQMIDPQTCPQQAMFGFVQDGTRECHVIDNTGAMLNPGYLGLESVRFADLPASLQTFMEETPVSEAPFGAVGLGEAAGVTPTQAIGMAVYNATGKIMEMPMTPDKVLAALGKV